MTGPASAGHGGTFVDGVDVAALAAAVRTCPGVSDLIGGAPSGAATYLPGQRVDGLRVDPDAVLIQVCGHWAVPAPELARQIRTAAGPFVAGRRIDIVLADVAAPDATASATSASALASAGSPPAVSPKPARAVTTSAGPAPTRTRRTTERQQP
jgi:hypothetical protein